MTLIESLAFGCLQGITEFLPVSSSGHLAILKSLFSLQEVPRLFDVLLHAATLCVVVMIFRRTLKDLMAASIRALLRRPQEDDSRKMRLIAAITAATLVTGIAGIALKDLGLEARPKIVSGLLLVTALILLISKKRENREGPRSPGLREGLITGLAQGIGVLPGISRSGITITAALLAGVNRREAGEFSFLLSLPAITGALVLSLKEGAELTAIAPPSVLAAGILASALTGCISLHLLLKLIRGGKLWLFAFYLVPAGTLGLIFL
ncbi:MAG: undecaprenyl-diphosphate phosphatase [Spirochaetales bacterium]|jgi:undecaprenyl-diphosphatase|nr:undecaprenyl-diphosphate phosphatase [Spirochaetales bacterium]